jgi:uncharacterized repeat protein (TIGR02543 family)
MKQTFSFRNLFLVVAVITSLLLTACGGGGGGGGGTNSTTSTTSVKVTIPGSLFQQPATEIRAAKALEKLTLKVVAYSNGKVKTDVKITDREATSNGTNFVATVDGLLNVYDYRFKVLNNNVELLSNQVEASEIIKDANININVDTSFKTMAYDSWLKKNPSNASVKNFKANSKEAGFTKDTDYNKLSLKLGNDNYTVDQYKENLIKAAKGETATLPTASNVKIDVDKIATIDKENEKNTTFTITYNLNGGKLSKNNPAKYGNASATITLNNPTKDGYNFTGWTGSNGNTPQTTVTIPKGSTGNKSFTANWEKEETSINKSLVGTWYLNEEDGKPVVPNSKGEVETMILNLDGSCSMTDYGLTDKNHSDYWETELSEGTDKGKWRYSNKKIYVTIDGVERSFEISISNDSLTIKGNYENSNGTWISVYKKTKYKLELYSGGSGTKSDPYVIAKAKDLNNIRYNLSSHYIQTKDIDLSEYGENYTAEFRGISGKGWVPIGGTDASDKKCYFTGTFNGNGYKITNLYINRMAPGQGLFSILGEGGNLSGINIVVHSSGINGTGIMGSLVALTASSSEISNCTVKNANINGYETTIGGLVGYSASNISNCSVECKIFVNILEKGDFEGGVGGLVGIYGGTSNIIDSKVECAINSKVGNVGGLIGKSNTTGYIKNSTAYGTVLCNEDVNAGGLIGNNSSTVEYCIAKVAVIGCYGCGGFVGVNSGKISKCYSSGSVGSVSSGNCGFTGGFAGTNSNQITDSYSISENIVAKSDTNKFAGNVSCFVGFNQENGRINRCYATGKAACSSTIGGIAGWNKGKINNSVALCEYVLALNKDTGRVVGLNDDGIIVDCYAISTMEVNKTYPTINIGTDKKNGETVNVADCQNENWWLNTLDFSSLVWSYSNTTKRMELNNMPSIKEPDGIN